MEDKFQSLYTKGKSQNQKVSPTEETSVYSIQMHAYSIQKCFGSHGLSESNITYHSATSLAVTSVSLLGIQMKSVS